MKLRRKSSAPAGRQRRQQPAGEPAASNTSYQAARRAGRDNVDRASQSSRLWRFWLQRTGLLILLIAIIISVINILSLSPTAKVIPVGDGSDTSFLRNQAAYQAAADKYLGSSIWNRNKITVDTDRFRKQMTDTFPELADVSVTLPLLAHRPVVYLEPAQPALVLTADNGAYVLDTNGRALLSSAELASTKGLPQVADQSGLQIERNRQVLAADDVRFIQTVTAQLAAKQVGIASMILPSAASELDVYIAKQPYYVKFNLHNDNPRQQVGTYLAAVALLQRQHVTPSKYIDVRVDGRAYYQ